MTELKNSPTLVVCMIVKNEERVLERCLDGLDGIYDELCIVDTGSTDKTVEIAQRYTDKVQVFHQCNDELGNIIDFSAARNRALEMTQADWVLQIDADEVIRQGKEHIRTHISREDTDRIAMIIRNGRADNDVLSGRLFRRSNAQGYKSAIHEYLEFDGRAELDNRLMIENLPNKEGKETGSERNIRLCLKQLEGKPNDSRTWYYLGSEYLLKQDFSQAAECFKNAKLHDNYKQGKYHVRYYLAVSLFQCHDWSGAVDAANEAVDIDDRYAESYCLLGDVFFTLGILDKAEIAYQQALSCTPPNDALLGTKPWAYQAHPASQLEKIIELSDA